MIVEFPDTKTDKQINAAMDALGEWVSSNLENDVSPIILLGLIDVYKAALTNNLLVDEDD